METPATDVTAALERIVSLVSLCAQYGVPGIMAVTLIVLWWRQRRRLRTEDLYEHR